MAVILSLLPSLCRLNYVTHEVVPAPEAIPAAISVPVAELTGSLFSNLSVTLLLLMDAALGNTLW